MPLFNPLKLLPLSPFGTAPLGGEPFLGVEGWLGFGYRRCQSNRSLHFTGSRNELLYLVFWHSLSPHPAPFSSQKA
jgi:hypothetical protein